MPLPDPPPIDPNIQYALAYLLQALSTPTPPFAYDTGVSKLADNGAEAARLSEADGLLIQNGSDAEASQARRRKRKLPKALSRSEVEALLGQPNLDAATGLRDRCMLELMYRAGMRVSEVCNLKPRNVDTAEGTVEIVAGKSGDRTARFNRGALSPLLEQWKRERRRLGLAGSPYFFCTVKKSDTPFGGEKPAGNRVSTRATQAMIKRRAAHAGVDPKRVTPHKLRHSFATHWLEDGGNLRDLQELLGHSNLATTEVYLSVVNVELQAKMQEWDPLAKERR